MSKNVMLADCTSVVPVCVCVCVCVRACVYERVYVIWLVKVCVQDHNIIMLWKISHKVTYPINIMCYIAKGQTHTHTHD